ncbi:MAG: LpxI family protein, partial [Pyrinomonadaceae bacterium]
LGAAFHWVALGHLGTCIQVLRNAGVAQAIMAGQVRHVQIFGGAIPDVRMLKVLVSLPRRNTDALIGAIAQELAGEGIELIDSTYFLRDQLPVEGTLTRRAPDSRERGDIEYGLEVAREIARLDLGQTIVVRSRACVAVEAMEGTDAAIRRAGELARGRLTVVKIAKPAQDMRFDVPCVGVPTIEAMIEAGASCLCLTAGKTLMFDPEEMIALADKQRISVAAVAPV